MREPCALWPHAAFDTPLAGSADPAEHLRRVLLRFESARYGDITEAAAAVPHALHMPSHIFTRLGYWDESAATNLRGWEVSEADVKRAGQSGAYRDFHNLNYLEYAYIQLGGFRDAQHTVNIAAAQYQALPDKQTAPDTPELQSRHVRGPG